MRTSAKLGENNKECEKNKWGGLGLNVVGGSVFHLENDAIRSIFSGLLPRDSLTSWLAVVGFRLFGVIRWRFAGHEVVRLCPNRLIPRSLKLLRVHELGRIGQLAVLSSSLNTPQGKHHNQRL